MILNSPAMVMKNYIEQNLTSNITIDDIAASVPLSRSRCIHLFKEVYHINLTTIILNCVWNWQKISSATPCFPYMKSHSISIFLTVSVFLPFSKNTAGSLLPAFEKILCQKNDPIIYKAFQKNQTRQRSQNSPWAVLLF